jgi:DNA-binding NtrC family response regulator
MKILFLEYHEVFANLVTRQFLAAHEVKIVGSVAAARAAIAEGSFDAVLCDYDLKDAKGDAFVVDCRAVHPGLPIVATSSHEDGIAALMSAGASAICGKYEFHKIEEVLKRFAKKTGETS